MYIQKYTQDILEEAAANSASVAGVCKYLGINNPGGSSQTNIGKRLKELEINTSHFLGKASRKGQPARNRKTAAEILVRLSQGAYRMQGKYLRRALIEIGREYVCEGCGNTGTWSGESLTLEVDHRDGDWHNNEEHNLRFLCPNCHSQKH
jgi:hypothetical protein